MSEPLHRLTIGQLGELIATRQISPTDLVGHFLERIEAYNPTLNAFTTIAADEAMECARGLTAEAARGAVRGPLHGIPIAIKDLTDTAGMRTTYGSSLYAAHVPTIDAAPVARLRADRKSVV